MAEENKKGKQIDVELSEAVADGTYANLAIISHSPTEFIVDFIRLMPGTPKAKVKSRIIMSPQHAKRLMAALADNLHKYESQFGEIETHDLPPDFPLNFGPAGEA